MKCLIIFSRKNKTTITNLSSADFAHSMVSVFRPSILNLNVPIRKIFEHETMYNYINIYVYSKRIVHTVYTLFSQRFNIEY